MAVTTATTLYLRNDTTVDTGTGVDVRVLSSTAGSTDETTSIRWAHTQENTERTFDPATALATNTNNAGTTLFKMGWALRLSEDMTPTDDTNCNAMLQAGSVSVPLDLRINMNGGTNLGGTNLFTIRASLWRYNPSTDAGTLIAAGSVQGSWQTGGLGENNQYKTYAVPITVAAPVEFSQGEILLLQVGCASQALSDPTLGSTNFDMTLRLASISLVSMTSGMHLTTLGAFTGSSAGVATVSGSASPVLNTIGTSTGTGSAAAVGASRADTVGASAGVSSTDGVMSSVAGTIGNSAGVSSVSGVLNGIGSMQGTVDASSSASGVMGAIGGMTGSVAGSSSASGVMGATGGMTGTAPGSALAQGYMSSLSGTVGNANSAASVNGVGGAVVGTVGTVEIGSGSSSETIIKRTTLLLFDD